MVLEAQPLIACGQDWETFEDLLERAFKPRAPNVYKGKSYIDCYNFIYQCKDYFATFEFRGCNQVLFATTFLKERVLNWS